ncbi:competence type IV pilus minor pilin ComGD [Streptococcus ruminantium]|uniref:Competence type IV pilus minor pilin ComGD n=3 Tax=Streptococcus ruminantium TaxID=1917441 RepID=A0ABU1B6F8_9STRE|nr:competence type IV pilus minor pilin ComGD [Streptococcus ruminantium]MDQ8759254.1 competence type IV pilus minor pilin ComGD [Streptococcus ruminantium]MDQ8764203.1 competence type IV pilus minor pilin ComGD [Streptococcus ruminantium]MDQ8768319.1 competence type IV pilus minor pilin ComGD [Streptococcus ruminantium]MDQ8775290.1 competence type IV pilus minor pilin ComGD [Streptococcus ruminantium]MDQ8793361.1 competence type IV pilus minor pilin ComGD [Streptococcus ruminantium]
MRMRRNKHGLPAFTLLESLLALFVVSLLTLILSGTVQRTFQVVQEQVFLWEFEALYKDSQQLAANFQQELTLKINEESLTNGYQTVRVPRQVTVLEEKSLVFYKNGGNSSLAKIRFRLKGKTVTYQLYMGSGRYKKSEE